MKTSTYISTTLEANLKQDDIHNDSDAKFNTSSGTAVRETFGKEMPNRWVMDQSTYVSYNMNNRKKVTNESGLTLSMGQWIIVSLFLAIILIPGLVIMTLFHIIFLYPIFMYRKRIHDGTIKVPFFVILMIFSLTMCILYVSNTSELTHFNSNIILFNTLVPIILCVMFKDAIVEHIKFRLYLLKIYEKFSNPKFGTNYHHFGILFNKLRIDLMIKLLLQNYWIWGETLASYEIFGDDYEWKVFYQIKTEYKQFKFKSIKKLYKQSAMFWFIISNVSLSMYIIIPTLYYTHDKNKDLLPVEWIVYIITIIFNCWVVYSIGLFVEIIFYRLFEYYKFMKTLTNLVQSSNLTGQNNLKVRLFDNDNWHIWYENWNRIQLLGCNFFKNRANVIFALFCCAAGCIVIIMLSADKNKDMGECLFCSVNCFA